MSPLQVDLYPMSRSSNASMDLSWKLPLLLEWCSKFLEKIKFSTRAPFIGDHDKYSTWAVQKRQKQAAYIGECRVLRFEFLSRWLRQPSRLHVRRQWGGGRRGLWPDSQGSFGHSIPEVCHYFASVCHLIRSVEQSSSQSMSSVNVFHLHVSRK